MALAATSCFHVNVSPVSCASKPSTKRGLVPSSVLVDFLCSYFLMCRADARDQQRPVTTSRWLNDVTVPFKWWQKQTSVRVTAEHQKSRRRAAYPPGAQVQQCSVLQPACFSHEASRCDDAADSPGLTLSSLLTAAATCFQK